MTAPIPQALDRIAKASGAAECERAWERFIDEFSPLLLAVARSLGGAHDAVMDRYAFMLEHLRCDGCRKLLSYRADPRATFRTWLALVARNLCRDHNRQRYGRVQSQSAEALAVLAMRRKLADLVAVQLDQIEIASKDLPAESRLEHEEVRNALDVALGSLDTHERLLIRMRFEDELSIPEIARITGYRNAFALYRKFDSILDQLRTRLRAAGVEQPVA